ncbi:hypothetical protein SAMN02745941_02663 [Clostridium intestinale DSM 6191]|uniref:Uncharacterized protein n=1 Tax=Clostridium intestinale DSM 6191 TaxID=1121320 RepID=A0A1M5Z9G6_9CLOT|nr:hypothetical protein SAMN02745941_02663 [Clostridium intestinale DSM 6191]
MRLIDLLIRLYPKEWRERYGEEIKEVIKESGNINMALIFDILKNAISTHLQPESYKRINPQGRHHDLKLNIRKLAASFGLAFILMTIGILVAMGISSKYPYRIQDVLLIEGLIVTVIGFFLIMGGNSSGLDMTSLGSQGSQYSSYMNLRTTEKERSTTKFYENFTKQGIISTTFNGLTIPLGGILIVVISYLI